MGLVSRPTAQVSTSVRPSFQSGGQAGWTLSNSEIHRDKQGWEGREGEAVPWSSPRSKGTTAKLESQIPGLCAAVLELKLDLAYARQINTLSLSYTASQWLRSIYYSTNANKRCR